MNGWIGVDLDGTLAVYDGWKGSEHIGAPVPRMVERVKKWLAEGKDVRIFTARVAASGRDCNGVVDDQAFADKIRKIIEAWCLEYIGQVLPVTAVKDFQMFELWDDRCKQVVPNEGYTVEEFYNDMFNLPGPGIPINL